MKKLNLSSALLHTYIELPVSFIDTFLPEAPENALKVYLYLLRASLDNSVILSVEDIADLFDVTPNTVLRSLKYWESLGLLKLTFADGELTDIVLCPFTEATPGDNALISDPESDFALPMPENVQPMIAAKNEPKVYDPMTLTDDPDFSDLLSLAEYYLGKPLNAKQHDSLAFCYMLFDCRSEIVEYLLEYCIEAGHPSFYYIEAVAKGWKEEGFRTLSEIKEHVGTRNKTVYSIMKAFGLSNRTPVREETDMIMKWAKEFDLPLILAACERTMSKIHSPNFRYTDSILSSWKAAGVKTVAEAEASDEAYRKKASENNDTPIRPTAKNNAFRNFKERNTDYNALIAGYYES